MRTDVDPYAVEFRSSCLKSLRHRSPPERPGNNCRRSSNNSLRYKS